MLAPKVTFSCKNHFFFIDIERALIYDELYIELNDVKWQTFAR